MPQSAAGTVTTRIVSSITAISADSWNGLAGTYPFLRHEFLLALEESGSIGANTAWQPSYLLASAGEQLVGALPLFAKYDSRGEFVFDWNWADAFERSGGRYYPKLVCAVPFTPATGPRILTTPGAAGDALAQELVAAAIAHGEAQGMSSIHILFPEAADATRLRQTGLLERKGCQFHWFNHGYSDFENFLSSFSSAKRKKVRRERRRMTDSGVTFERLPADALAESDWDAVYEFCARTFMLRGRMPYLNRAFFHLVAKSMPESLIVVLARHSGRPIAAAICFRSSDMLYGRYWGSMADFHSLHFETCYYQGIEYCIEHGLSVFEPGTQGEHKVSRGFVPTPTWSYHRLFNAGFETAVADFLERETPYIDEYMDDVAQHTPFRRESL